MLASSGSPTYWRGSQVGDGSPADLFAPSFSFPWACFRNNKHLLSVIWQYHERCRGGLDLTESVLYTDWSLHRRESCKGQNSKELIYTSSLSSLKKQKRG